MRGADCPIDGSVAAAYSATGAAWQAGPGRVYDVLARHLVAPISIGPGDLALDLGAGSGAASRVLRGAGAHVIALDIASGMLRSINGGAVARVVGDARALPFGSATLDVVVAAFSLNHVADPVQSMIDVRRVLREGGRFAASVYAVDDDHPVKHAVEVAASAMGWSRPSWLADLALSAIPALATVDRAESALVASGLNGDATAIEVPIVGLTAVDMVEWRLGMAQLAPFVATLDDTQQAALRQHSRDLLGPTPEPLVRRVVHLHAVR
jgi:SAM-dependent methyltransferase